MKHNNKLGNKNRKPTRVLLLLVFAMMTIEPLFAQQTRNDDSVLQIEDELIIDSIPLRPGINWISFPRLEREDDDTVPSIPTVENRIFPVGYQYAELSHLPFTAPPEPDEDDELVMFYEYPGSVKKTARQWLRLSVFVAGLPHHQPPALPTFSIPQPYDIQACGDLVDFMR